MVDSRKSAQAKQQRRNRDGTYADEGKTSSMPTGDVLERFEQNQQSNTGGAPVETYETGVKRMQELDQKLIDIANREYSERKFGPDDEGYRVESGLYVSREEFEKLPELDRDRYIAWGNDYMDGNEDAWNDRSKCPNLPVKPPKMVMPKCISPIRNSPTRMTWIIPSASIWSPRVVTRSRLRKARTWLSKATPIWN